jgi:hypothetical protein
MGSQQSDNKKQSNNKKQKYHPSINLNLDLEIKSEFKLIKGYKKCRDNKIVVLEINSLDRNNMLRKNIIDKQHAHFRCDLAKVIDIYDMNNKDIKYSCAISFCDPKFKYKLNNIVRSDDYCTDIEQVRECGIHYFLYEESAYFYSILQPANGINVIDYTGPYKEWRSNGRLCIQCHYVNSKLSGKYESYYENGDIHNRWDSKN